MQQFILSVVLILKLVKLTAAGYLAKLWTEQGQRVITQKLVQTGNIDISEDIETS